MRNQTIASSTSSVRLQKPRIPRNPHSNEVAGKQANILLAACLFQTRRHLGRSRRHCSPPHLAFLYTGQTIGGDRRLRGKHPTCNDNVRRTYVSHVAQTDEPRATKAKRLEEVASFLPDNLCRQQLRRRWVGHKPDRSRNGPTHRHGRRTGSPGCMAIRSCRWLMDGRMY